MAISVNPATFVITIPQADLTFVSGTLYTLDTEAFREELRAWEDDEENIVFQKTHDHFTEYTVAGVTYARAIIMLAPYTIEFEDLGHPGYTVALTGSNNNIFEAGIIVTNHNSVIGQNAAGLIVHSSGSGLSTEESEHLLSIPLLGKLLALLGK